MQRVNETSDSKDPGNGPWFLLLRVGLGMSLFIRGISFLQNSILIDEIVARHLNIKQNEWLWIPIASTHLFCGFMIITGLFLRWVILLQTPILIGGLIFTNIQKGFFSFDPEVGFGFIILLLLVFFFIEGSGPHSGDRILANGQDRKLIVRSFW